MADKFPDFAALITSLANSKIQGKDNALYQTIFLLIKNMVKSQGLTITNLEEQGADIGALLNATYLTVDDETALLVNSRRLLAGTNIAFDDTVAGQRTINSSGGGGNTYDAPLTDGDVDETDLIFANGECVIVQVPNP